MSLPVSPAPLTPLLNREIRDLKGRAQRLQAVTKLGKGGLSPEFLAAVDLELTHHELIKIKLTEHKDQRYELADEMALKTASHLICVIGHVIVLYRPKPETAAAPAGARAAKSPEPSAPPPLSRAKASGS